MMNLSKNSIKSIGVNMNKKDKCKCGAIIQWNPDIEENPICKVCETEYKMDIAY